MKEQTILTEEVLAEIEQLEDEGYMYQVLDVINRFSNAGIERGDFRVSDVYTDLQVALHVAYADINIDDYEHYEHAERWLARTESKAAGCGVWYYRYSVSLMYLSRLKEALDYQEKGVLEEPDYPWGWLQLAAMRCHFGNVKGALEAVDRGLELVPGDYEFLQRREEIKQGKTLSEMANHYINEEDDKKLAELDENDELRKSKTAVSEGILGGPKKLKKPSKGSGSWGGGWGKGPSTPK